MFLPICILEPVIHLTRPAVGIEFVLVLAVLVATFTDLRTRRIPNWLTYSSLAAALVLRFVASGWAGLKSGLVGVLVAAEALWNVFSSGHPWLWIMLATLGAALALIGPGAWSIDARLFGWRRLKIRDQKSQDSPP